MFDLALLRQINKHKYTTMKKLNYFMIAILAVFVLSCNNETDPPPASDAPSITPPTGTTLLVGETINIDFAILAPGKVASVTVAASDGTATIDVANSIEGATEGTVTVTYVAPLSEGTQTVTLTVVDQQSTPKTTTSDASIEVTLAPTSTVDLLVAKFAAAPAMDGDIDDMWNTAQQLVGSLEVPTLDARGTWLNSDGEGSEEDLGLFFPYSGETSTFTMRSGTFGDDIYFLIEWEDSDDSKDRQSWYYDNGWKGEHKYANAADDKYYEDKFAFLFPIGNVDNFSASTCYATCHTGLELVNDKDKNVRHFLKGVDQKVDMWHWKRVRGTYADQVDDQKMTYKEGPYNSSSNGRTGDADGVAGYSGNSQTLNNGTADVSVPLYVIPNETDYYWIDKDQIDNGTAKLITAVDGNGVLTYDGGTIDPADGGYEQGTGTKRIPSVNTKAFEGPRADISVKAVHTGTGWVCEVKRKLNTGDPDDAVFNPAEEMPFGFAIFNNAAIAHAIKPGLNLKFEQ